MKAAYKHWLAKHFNASFYLAKYPDVQRAGVEAWQHYKHNGWKEKRDPSAYFSSRHYLEQCKEEFSDGQDLLTHFYHHGHELGFSAHPFLSMPGKNKQRIGVVMFDGQSLSAHPSSKAVLPTITAFVLPVIDGKDPKESAQYESNDKDVVAHVNQALSYLDDHRCSHIHFCYSSDRLSSNGVEQLLECNHPLVAPALLGRSGPQFIPEIGAYNHDKAFEKFAKLWQRSFSKRLLLTSYVDTSLTLVSNELVKALNGFDEGYVEFKAAFADFCMRAKQIGIDPAVARHCVGRNFDAMQDDDVEKKKQDFFHFNYIDRARFAAQHPGSLVDLSIETNNALYSDTINRLNSFSRGVLKFQNSALQKLTERTVQTTQEASSELIKLNQWHQLATRELQSFNENEEAVLDIPFVEPLPFGGDEYLDPDELAKNKLFGDIEKVIGPLKIAENGNLYLSLGKLALKLSEIFAKEAPILFCCGHYDPFRSNPNDGYVQRLRAIDSIVAGRIRVYLNFQATEEIPANLVQLSPKLWVLNCRVDLALGRELLSIIVDKFDLIYVHSPLALPNSETADLLSAAKPTLFLDAHGAVPEELSLVEDPELVEEFSKIEEILISQAQHIICVSKAMGSHFRKKYRKTRAKFLTLPAVSNRQAKNGKKTSAPAKPTMIYAGGAQPWQCVPEMCRFFGQMKDIAEYRILSPAIDEMHSALCEAGESIENVTSKVISVPSEDVEKWLVQAQYGILLREDITVNRVSCPTKLIEYLKSDLVPILASTDIGDFKEFNFKYLNYEDVLQKGLPTEETRLAMVVHNRKAMGTFHACAQTSWQELRLILGSEE